MSKRFGRQQKKKLKQQIEQQERALSYKDDRISDLNLATQRAQDVIAAVRRVNPHFPALEEVSEIAANLKYYTYETRKSTPCTPYSDTTTCFDEAFTINHVDLHTLEVNLQECREFGDSVLFMVNAGNERYHMKLSNSALHTISDKQLSNYLAKEFLQAIREKMNEQQRRY